MAFQHKINTGIDVAGAARLFSRIGLPAYVMNRTGFSLAEQLIGLQRGDVLIPKIPTWRASLSNATA
jgi:hypothetical protein